ncbi:MAG: hypothetical protein WDN67_00605 [Candidatus Moraniibacteriota bacterium]
MATQYETDLIGQGVTPEFIETERAKGKGGLLKGVNVDEQDFQPILTAFRSTGNPYSAGNMQNALANPTAPPNLSDPYGLQSSIYASEGVDSAQKEYLDAIAFLRNYDQGSLEQQNFLEDQTIAMPVITGQQASQARLRSAERQGFAAKADTFRDAYLSKKEAADRRYQVATTERERLLDYMATAPGAGITLTDTPEIALTKINKYNEKQKKKEKEEAKKAADDAYSKELKATARELGISTKTSKGGTMNTKQLEAAIAKENKSLVSDAKRKSQLELKALEADIENTYSTIANRGKSDDDELDKEFEKEAKSLAQEVRDDKMTREDAKRLLMLYYPNYDENVIYDLVADK